jgi:hypothetical protein
VVGIDRCSVYPGLIRFPTLRLDLMFCIYSIMVYSGLCLDRNHSICKFMNNYTFDFINTYQKMVYTQSHKQHDNIFVLK